MWAIHALWTSCSYQSGIHVHSVFIYLKLNADNNSSPLTKFCTISYFSHDVVLPCPLQCQYLATKGLVEAVRTQVCQMKSIKLDKYLKPSITVISEFKFGQHWYKPFTDQLPVFICLFPSPEINFPTYGNYIHLCPDLYPDDSVLFCDL